jgi:hypothetical protein
MLSHAELTTLEQKLRNETVLSIYVNGDFADVAARSQWRTQLRNALDEVEASLRDATHADREGFAAARALALKEVEGYKSGDDSPGWMGLFSQDTVHYSGVASVSFPTIATWSVGANLAPAIRMLKESRPVLVVVTDSTRVRIHRYVGRKIALEESIDRAAKVDEPDHLNKPLPKGFYSGAGGIPGADAAQRELNHATDVMLSQAATRISQVAGDEALVLIGGIDVVASALHSRLEKRLESRSAIVPLDIHDNLSRLAELAREHASRLRSAEDLKRVEEVLSANAAGGTGAVGLADIDRALFNGQVHELYVTSDFVEKHADEAVTAIRRAFDESATVEHVSGEAANVLDAAGGIAARLRFTIQPASESTAAAS